MVRKLNLIWIGIDAENEEYKAFLNELNTSLHSEIKCFLNEEEGINYIKTIKFENIKIIINGKFYINFIQQFSENLHEIYVIPKLIIFTKDKDDLIENNKNYENIINNPFYNFAGIKTSFNELKKFLQDDIVWNKKIRNDDDEQLTFEYIDSTEKLELPLFYKTLLDLTQIDKIEKYNELLYSKYCDNNDIEELLSEIKSIPNIPLELLSKYYARMYTADSNFYNDINKDLRNNKKENYLSFIKVLYEGVKLKSLKLASNKELYRGSKISSDEINIINNYLNKKISHLPGAIVFSKSFLSFTKDRNIATKFLNFRNENNNFYKVLYILEKDDNIDYNLSTHGDIENLSCFPNEKEVLFFPFSTFEIKDIKEIKMENEIRYEIKLLYLGKYLKKIEKDKNIVEKENEIPNTEFKKQIVEIGLVKPENIKNTKQLFKHYKQYSNDNNYITAKIKINKEDINKDIRIINSFEKYKIENKIENSIDDIKYENEQEIKENIQIKIDKKYIDFCYFYKFEYEGEYIINYFFRESMTNTNYMFCNCNSIISIDLSNFNTRNIINMNHMFYFCHSLMNINLSNFDTEKVTNMSYMFSNCSSLLRLNFSSFNTENVTNMSEMFYNCKSLTTLNLSYFNTENVKDMDKLFFGCKSLINLNLSNFTTKNVKYMNRMFNNCDLLYRNDIKTNDYKILNLLNN